MREGSALVSLFSEVCRPACNSMTPVSATLHTRFLVAISSVDFFRSRGNEPDCGIRSAKRSISISSKSQKNIDHELIWCCEGPGDELGRHE